MDRLLERNDGDEPVKVCRIDLEQGVDLVENVLELGVLILDAADRLMDGFLDVLGAQEGLLGRGEGFIESGGFGPVHGLI